MNIQMITETVSADKETVRKMLLDESLRLVQKNSAVRVRTQTVN